MSFDTIGSMQAMFKTQFLEKGLQKVIPAFAHILGGVKFVGQAEKSGNELVFPVQLSREHGFTAMGQQGENTSLRPSTTAQLRQAKVLSYAYMGRTEVSNTLVARAIGSAQSFENIVNYKVMNLQESFTHMVETGLLYGQDALGKVAAGAEASATYGGTVFVNGLSGRKMKIASKEFADHIWIGSEGLPVDVYTAGGVLAFSASVVNYDDANEWIEVDGIPATITNVEGFEIERAGFRGNQGPGLFRILKQTAASSALFGIDSATAPLWKPSQYNVQNQALSFEAVAEGVSRAVSRGLTEKADLLCHNQIFASLMPDFNTIKQGGANFKSRTFVTGGDVETLQHGTKAIRFQVGSVEMDVVANPLIKKGYAALVAMDELARAGSTEVTYSIPGSSDDGQYWRSAPGSAVYELQIYTDQTLMSRTLNQHLLFSNIKVDAPIA
jgi:hypothetical protein